MPPIAPEETVQLSVVIPAFEEAARIGPTLERVRTYLAARPFESEVLVVVDGGRDGTLGLVRNLARAWPALRVLDNGVNRGKGYSVRRGMLAARGRYLLFSDADLSTPIAEVERLVAALDAGADVAIGSRALVDSDVRVRQAWWRQSMGPGVQPVRPARRRTGPARHTVRIQVFPARRGAADLRAAANRTILVRRRVALDRPQAGLSCGGIARDLDQPSVQPRPSAERLVSDARRFDVSAIQRLARSLS